MNFGMIISSLNMSIKREYEDFYKDIANDVEKSFDTSKYDKNDGRPLPIGKK